MLRSLVGSEMCIRDRPYHTTTLGYPSHAAPSQPSSTERGGRISTWTPMRMTCVLRQWLATIRLRSLEHWRRQQVVTYTYSGRSRRISSTALTNTIDNEPTSTSTFDEISGHCRPQNRLPPGNRENPVPGRVQQRQMIYTIIQRQEDQVLDVQPFDVRSRGAHVWPR